MATYEELYSIHNHSILRNKVTTACIIAAEIVMNEDPGTTNHANRVSWAQSVFVNPRGEAERMFYALLAANADLTIAQIAGATDAAIQAGVDDHIDLFANGV